MKLMLQRGDRCCLVAQSCPTLCNPRLPCPSLSQTAQTHVHWAGDAIQPSHPQSPPSPPAFNLSQHQGLFQGVSSLLSLNVKPHKFQRYEEQVCGAACVTVECELGHVVIEGCPQGGNIGDGIKIQGEGPEGQHVQGPCGSREHSPLEELTKPEGEGGGLGPPSKGEGGCTLWLWLERSAVVISCLHAC